MFYEISLLLLLLAGRAASTEVINNDNIDQQKHPDVLRLIVTNSSAKVNLRGLTPDTSSGLTSAPLSSGSFCPAFSLSDTNSSTSNYAVCSFMACPGDTVLMTTLSPGSCSGDTYLRLYDGPSQLTYSDDYNGKPCSQIIYTFASSGACRAYEIREGCFSNTLCRGQVYFTVITSAPTPAPTSAPSPLSTCAMVDENYVATVSCPSSTFVRSIKFASYGTPTGSCGAFSKSWCDSSNSMSVVTGACLNKATCSVSAQNWVFDKNYGEDPCYGTPKRLYIQAACALTPISVCATANEGSVATITCPDNTWVGAINFASYGTPGGSCGIFSLGWCSSSNSMSVVTRECLNARTCTIRAQNSVFGDPCARTGKRLYIEAACNPTPLLVCAEVNENYVATISCPSGTVVRTIDFASYGTPTGSCGQFFKSSCDSSNSISTVQIPCLNQASCTVSAQNSVFGGDPCGGTLKRLKIQATCGL